MNRPCCTAVKITLILLFLESVPHPACHAQNERQALPVRLLTLDPGHFHAALVQKKMLPGIDTTVHIYAPPGNDVALHLARIQQYNQRKVEPTRWKQQEYVGNDYFERMLTEKKGNVVVISGNNQKKSTYILKSLQKGMHVFADKPMAIDKNGFRTLKRSFNVARRKQRILYDIMTERFEITTLLQREISKIPSVFGELQTGNEEEPAITKESVHHFSKSVSGKPLIRPAWFLDVSQQGEGMVDVMTHLVDLVQWESFPEQPIQYPKDIRIYAVKRWPTSMTKEEFKNITQLDQYPSFLQKDLTKDSALQIYCNGEIRYTLKGIHVKTSVTWQYKALPGTGDTHFSIMRGTKCQLAIRQGKEEDYKPVLYIEPLQPSPSFEDTLRMQFRQLEAKFTGISLIPTDKGWKVWIPEDWIEDHEAHFSRVAERFLEYVQTRTMPTWEIPNMLAKYYTTTKALSIAKKKKRKGETPL